MTWVGAKCPVCGCVIPTFEVKAFAKGFLRRNVSLTVNGDATDWIVHLWSHRDERNQQWAR